MANTVYGPFAAINVVNGSTPANATWGNNVQTQASVAMNGFNGDLLTAFVLSGITCTKDGVTANQLDIAAGRAYITMSDGTRGLIVVGADNTHTTSGASVTWYLALQPDGTWYWNTVDSPATHSLSIATVTTDASGNIATVTDTRPLTPTLLSTMAGDLTLPTLANATVAGTLSLGTAGATVRWSSPQIIYMPPSSGAANGHIFQAWDGAALHNSVSLGANLGGSSTWIGATGNVGAVAGQASAGSFGVPVIVAQTINQHIIATGNQTVLSFTPAATGMYRLNGWFEVHSGTGGVNFLAGWNDPTSGVTGSGYFVSNTATPAAWNNVSVNATGGAQVFSNSPLTFYAGTGAAITVTFGGTNDCYVSVILERLS